MIELEEVTRIWKGLLYTLIGKINIMKNLHSTKTILQIQCNLNKKNLQWHYSQKQRKDPKISMEQQKTTESQSNPEQKNKVGGISILDFKT